MQRLVAAVLASLLIGGCAASRTKTAPAVVEEPPPLTAAIPDPEPVPEAEPEPLPPPVEIAPPEPAPPPAPPAAPPPEEPAVRPAPRVVPPPVVRPAPRAPAPEPSPPPPIVAARVPHEDQVAQEVSQRLLRTQEVVEKIDASKLSRDQREIFSGILDFIAKAREAYQAKDMPRAQVLAEKASKLADDLAQSVKR